MAYPNNESIFVGRRFLSKRYQTKGVIIDIKPVYIPTAKGLPKVDLAIIDNHIGYPIASIPHISS